MVVVAVCVQTVVSLHPDPFKNEQAFRSNPRHVTGFAQRSQTLDGDLSLKPHSSTTPVRELCLEPPDERRTAAGMTGLSLNYSRDRIRVLAADCALTHSIAVVGEKRVDLSLRRRPPRSNRRRLDCVAN